MRFRRRHATVDEVVDPSPFDYTLLSHLYVHADGTDVIDMAGLQPNRANRNRVASFLKNRSFAPGKVPKAPEETGSYLHLQVPEDDGALHVTSFAAVPGEPHEKARHRVSNLVRIEDEQDHIWLMAQTNEEIAPYARLFSTPSQLLSYLKDHHLSLPTATISPSEINNTSLPINRPVENTGHSNKPLLPLAKWVDIQVRSDGPASSQLLTELLNLLPIAQETKDNCLFLSPFDAIETDYVDNTDDPSCSYLFVNLMCTPVVVPPSDPQSTLSAHSNFFSPMHSSPPVHASFLHPKGGRAPTTAPHRCDYCKTKSVMEMRFEAVRNGISRSSVPEPVPVAVILFSDWVFTIHSKPFAEMDDLLRMLMLHCGPQSVNPEKLHSNMLLAPSMRRRFTTPLILDIFLQIAVGHHLDSVTLSQAVDELGDYVFDVKEEHRDQDKVLERITAVRLCFGECSTDVARREVIFATLLQPSFSDLFLFSDATIRVEFENAQAHLWNLQKEITDCRETVALSNWYHNVALQWKMLRRGNRALRMVLLLTEVTNIMYPIIMVQTLYAMNVRVPFEAEGDPPNNSLAPFFVLAAVFILFGMLSIRVVRQIMIRKPFQTRLLA